MEQFIEVLTHLVHKLGYIGLFIATFVESTFVPIPAEVTMIPAGILAAKGEMNYMGALASSTMGVIGGSLFNYWIGYKYGRGFIVKYGRFVLLKESFLDKVERFFLRHGPFTIFAGRLLPGIRHYIAFPAGLAKMPIKKFVIFTALGGVLWMWILLHIGWLAGIGSEDGKVNIDDLEEMILGLSAVLVVAYLIKLRILKNH